LVNFKKKFEDEALAIFCSRCKNKHLVKICPLNAINVCGVCTKNHETNDFPSLLGLEAIYKGVDEPTTQSTQRKPWQP
jgi:hypothetical protein